MTSPSKSFSESVLRAVRGILPRAVYFKVSAIWDWASAARVLGPRHTIRLRAVHVRSRSQKPREPISVSASNLQFPFWLRPGSSDVPEFLYTIARESYGKYLPRPPVEFILDLGANIGDTAAWFLSRFPDARLVAVEPDAENFAVLQRNAEGYAGRIILERAAVWPYSTTLTFVDQQASDAVQVRDAEGGECSAVTVPQLMRKYAWPRIDLLKCDIEGAEKELFSMNADEWLAKTNFLVVETHGPECLQAVLDAVTRHGFEHRCFRNLHIFRRERQVARARAPERVGVGQVRVAQRS